MSLRKGNTLISGVGIDGISPSASVSKVGAVSTLTVMDASGTTTVNINDGENNAYNINTLTGTTVNLSADTVNTIAISNDTTFVLPTPTDNKFHQILVIATITGTPTITLGTTHYFNASEPVINAGIYNIIYEHDGSNWYAGAIAKGSDV